ncbi:MATE family efflux transporter [uncultured Vibrio sp.]|uniref:MATE family efflux transporter n=1 Tax=uncultured Vibrio sp. TaxID=114054 RepID=UPI0025E37566|nr:MATE family efflux transporter [uncultured Vibrio sp.]
MFSPTLKLVIQRTLPLTVGMFAIMLVQLVDSVFIGMLGLDQLTIHGITLPFQVAFIGVQVGIGVAATAIISKSRGEQDHDKSKNIASLTVSVGPLFIALIGALLWVMNVPILSAFTSDDVTQAHYLILLSIFQRYWPVWLVSALSVATLYLVTCVYRANEDTKTTGQMFLLASLINLVLDPIFIFTFDMGITGAALATTVGYASCTLFLLHKARSKRWFNRLTVNSTLKAHAIELIRITIPTTVNQSLPSLSAFLCMLFIAQIGTEAVAFWSLLSRIESFLLVFTLALTMAVPPIIGRYLGEGEFGKITELLITTAKFILVSHLLAAFVVALSSPLLVPLLSADHTMQHWFEVALWIIPFSYAPLGLCMVVVSVFNALGKPKRALLVSFIRLIALYIPAIWVGTATENVIYTVMAAALANTLAGGYAWFMLKQHTELQLNHSLLTEA